MSTYSNSLNCKTSAHRNKFEDHVYRRLIYNKNEKNMTICIAAICNIPNAPTVLFCADRLVSAGIQFDAGTSKITQITPSCVIMTSSNDSLISESIMQRLRKHHRDEPGFSVEEITDLLSKECIAFKKETLEQNVLSNYNLVAEKLRADPKEVLSQAIEDLDDYENNVYPVFEFIIGGLDEDLSAHIFKVDQHGRITPWDILGFTTSGSGWSLAFSEMTKWVYATQYPLVHAIPRVYFAKKASERSQGVGRSTDFAFLTFVIDQKNQKRVPRIFNISTDSSLMNKLDEAHEKIIAHEGKILTDMQNEILKTITQEQKQQIENLRQEPKTNEELKE